eukprot:COSAG01_NODE_58_length_30193_cov_12.302020_18_plen_65_part_00
MPTWTGGATRAGVKGGRRWALYRRASGAGVSTTGVPTNRRTSTAGEQLARKSHDVAACCASGDT